VAGVAIPPAIRAQLEAASFWHLVTINPDGTASATPVWVGIDGGEVLVNTAIGRRKERNARREPRVVLATYDRENPYWWIEIAGRVVEFVEGDVAEASIEELAEKYLGRSRGGGAPGERRVLLRIEPTAIRTNNEAGGRAHEAPPGACAPE
jgi:PPOX class probable F420-dependent enzyme